MFEIKSKLKKKKKKIHSLKILSRNRFKPLYGTVLFIVQVL